MKTKFYFLPILLLGGLSLFTACSDDDDENGGGQPSAPENGGGQPAAPVIGSGGTNSGARLTSISNGRGVTMYFQYNEDGTVQRIFDEYYGEVDDWIAMTYNPFRMETNNLGELKNISFNLNGYLTHCYGEGTYEGTYEEDDEWEKYKEDYSYSYNGNGNLTKIVNSYSYNGVVNGENYSGHATYTGTFTWSEGNLTRLEIVHNRVEDGETLKSIATYDFEYTDEINKYKQYVIGLNDFDAYYEEWLEPVGWLGKWTKSYPASFVYKFIEDPDGQYEYEYTDTGSWSNFSTTSDGLLSGFNYNGKRYTYTYDNTAPTAKKAAAKQMLDKNAPSPRTKKMSLRHLRHARMLNRK